MIVLMAKYAILNSKWRSPKWYPQIIHFSGIVHYKPSSFGCPH